MRNALILAVASTALFAPVDAQEPDLRCTHADRAVTGQLRMMLEDPSLERTITVYHAMAKMTAARIDCRRGRTERGLEIYRQLDALLASQGPERVVSK